MYLFINAIILLSIGTILVLLPLPCKTKVAGIVVLISYALIFMNSVTLAPLS